MHGKHPTPDRYREVAPNYAGLVSTEKAQLFRIQQVRVRFLQPAPILGNNNV